MNREYIGKHPWMVVLLAAVLALPALLPSAALADPQIMLSFSPSADIAVGTVIHFSITGDPMDAYSVMIVTPDSSQEFLPGAETDYVVRMPGRHVFIGYGNLNGEIWMTEIATVTATAAERPAKKEEDGTAEEKEKEKEEAYRRMTERYRKLLYNVDHSFTVTFVTLYRDEAFLRFEEAFFKTVTNPSEAISRVYHNITGDDRADIYETVLIDYLNDHVPEYRPPDLADQVLETVDAATDNADLAVKITDFMSGEDFLDVPVADILNAVTTVIRQWKIYIEKWGALDVLMQETEQNLEKLANLRSICTDPEMRKAIDKLGYKIWSGLFGKLSELNDPNSEIAKFYGNLAADAALSNIPIVGPASMIAKLADKIYDYYSDGMGINHLINDTESVIDHYAVMMTAREAFDTAVEAERWEDAETAAQIYYCSVRKLYEACMNMKRNQYKSEVQQDIANLDADYGEFIRQLDAYQAFP